MVGGDGGDGSTGDVAGGGDAGGSDSATVRGTRPRGDFVVDAAAEVDVVLDGAEELLAGAGGEEAGVAGDGGEPEVSVTAEAVGMPAVASELGAAAGISVGEEFAQSVASGRGGVGGGHGGTSGLKL